MSRERYRTATVRESVLAPILTIVIQFSQQVVTLVIRLCRFTLFDEAKQFGLSGAIACFFRSLACLAPVTSTGRNNDG
jgi:hypothetical protein